MSVTIGARLHLMILSSGVTSILIPFLWPARLRYSLGRRRHPYTWRQWLLTGTGTIPGSGLSKKSSGLVSPIFATFPSVQTLPFFAIYLNGSFHLLPPSNPFRWKL